MAECAVSVAAIDTADVTNNAAFTTRLTLSAATLAADGFSNNDEAIVIVFGVYHQANVATSQSWRLQYNAATVGPTVAPVLFSANFVNGGRAQGWMTRLNLGTLADFTLQTLRAGTSANCTIEKARIIVIRAMNDSTGLGQENVDWFWNKSTTNVAHTTTYSGTSRASITWTPSVATEDWLVLFSDNINIDSVTVRAEGRVLLDGATLVAGDYAEEGEDLSEIWTHFGAGIMENLSVASHTIAYQSRDDVATAANDHRESSLLLVRAGRFPDLKWATPADNAAVADTDEIIANVTDSLSAAQDAIIIASMRCDVGTADEMTWFWVEDNGTPIAPDLDSAAGTDAKGNAPSFDAVDENQCTWVGVSARPSGAQDVEAWARCSSATPGNFEEITLVVWGLVTAAAAAATSSPLAGSISPTMRHLVRQR